MVRRAVFLQIFEKSWSKCKHAFQPKDVTIDPHMLAKNAEMEWGTPPEQGQIYSADFPRIFAWPWNTTFLKRQNVEEISPENLHKNLRKNLRTKNLRKLPQNPQPKAQA